MNVMLTFLLTDFFLSELGYVQKKNIQRKMTFISWVDRGLVSWYLSRSIYDVKIIIINVANDEADFLFSFSFWSRICKINAFFFCCFWVEWKKIFTFFLNHDLFSNSNQNSIIIIWTWNWYLFFFLYLAANYFLEGKK